MLTRDGNLPKSLQAFSSVMRGYYHCRINCSGDKRSPGWRLCSHSQPRNSHMTLVSPNQILICFPLPLITHYFKCSWPVVIAQSCLIISKQKKTFLSKTLLLFLSHPRIGRAQVGLFLSVLAVGVDNKLAEEHSDYEPTSFK